MKFHTRIVTSWSIVLASLWISLSGFARQTDPAEAREDRVQAEPPATSLAPTKFIRLQTDEFGNPLALQTATVKYARVDDDATEPLEVVLESVIHVADSSYYRGFQKRFERYESVLYESIVNQDEPAPSGDLRKMGMLDLLQQLSTGTLGLAYQFEEVDYQAGNLLHADLSLKEILARMDERGENRTTLFSDLLSHIIQKVNVARKNSDQDGDQANPENDAAARKPSGMALDLSVFRDPDGIMKIRRTMALALVDSGLLESPFPPAIHRMIVGDRNDGAMSVLDAEIRKGRRRLAIFYGVGHMADFERRLISEYGMKKVAVNWRNAWDLRDGAIEGAPLEGLVESAFRDSFKTRLRQFARDISQKKPEAQDALVEPPETEAEKDRQLEAMEQTLKALEARLLEMEKAAREDKGKQTEQQRGKGDGQAGDDKQDG